MSSMRLFSVFVGFWLVLVLPAYAQVVLTDKEVIANVKTAMQVGSAKELARYFKKSMEVNLLNKKTSCTKNEAEQLFKDFFAQYKPKGFQYSHQGTTKNGLIYAVGKYSYLKGNSKGQTLVYLQIKKINDSYQIEVLDCNFM